MTKCLLIFFASFLFPTPYSLLPYLLGFLNVNQTYKVSIFNAQHLGENDIIIFVSIQLLAVSKSANNR